MADNILSSGIASSEEVNALNEDSEIPTTDHVETPEETPEEESDDEEEASDEETDALSADSESEEETETPEEETPEEIVEDESIPKIEDQITRPSFKAVQKKYPNIFKEFPEMKEMYFRDSAYGAIFTSIDDAKQTAVVAEVFNDINHKLSTGDITGVISAIGEQTLPNFAENVLFAIRDVSPKDYFRAISPAISEILNAAYNDGEKKGNRQLQLSVKNLCNFLYDKPELPKLPNKAPNPVVDSKLRELEERERSIVHRESKKFYDSIESAIDNKLKSWVLNGLDPNNEMSPFVKDAIINATLNDIQQLTRKDQQFMSTLKLMYNKAAKVGWTDAMKSQIISSYLGRVKDSVGSIKSRRRLEALGKRLKEKENFNPNKTSKTSRTFTSPSNGSSKNQNKNFTSIRDKNVNASKIDMRKTSEMDVLNGKAILR